MDTKSKVLSFRLVRTFCLTDADFPHALIAELIEHRGFTVEPVAVASPRKENKVAVKRKIRRRKLRRALTSERIREFRKARESGKSYRRIGAIFGVSEGRAWQIINKGR